MDDKEIKYEILGDATGYVASLERAAAATNASSAAIKTQLESVGAAFAAVQSKLMMLAAVVAGGAFFKDAIAASNKLAGEQMGLAKRLGISGEQASALNTALTSIGSDSDTYIGAFDKFAKQLKTNEAGLKDMGIQTRDANGNLRDSNTLFTEALGTVGKYKPGLDQTTAAMTLFGKGVGDAMALQKLNNGLIEEARVKNERLGLVLSVEGVAATKAYRASMADVGLVLLAVKNAVGQAVMPVFTELGNWFSSAGPAVVNAFKVALTGLLLAFRGVQYAVKLLANAVVEAVTAMVDVGFMLGDVFSKLFAGDFSGAVAASKGIGARLGEAWKRGYVDNANGALKEAQEGFAGDLQRIWNPTAMKDAPKGGTRTMGDFDKTKGGGADKSRMSAWEAQLAEQKLAFQEQENAAGTFHQFSHAQEADYWRAMLALTVKGTAENISVRKKLAEVQLTINKELFAAEVAGLHTQAAEWKNNSDNKLAILARESELMRQRYGQQSKEYEEVQKRIVETKRQAAEQLLQIEAISLQRIRAAQQSELMIKEEASRLDLALGLIDQAQMLAMQQQFEAQRYAISRQALQDKLALMARDPDRSPVELARINAEIAQLEQQHQQRLAQIRTQASTESARNITSTLGNIQAGWGRLIQQLAQGTLSIGGFIKGIFSTVASAVVQTLAAMAAKWMVQQVAMMIFGKTMGLSEIATQSALAGAGGVASMAAAPFPINLSAPAFGAAMAAAALAFAPVASAAGGYDIPNGLNPLVQTHAREMILPAKYADVIRQQADGGGGGGGGLTVHNHVTINTPMDGRTRDQLLADIAIATQRATQRNR